MHDLSYKEQRNFEKLSPIELSSLFQSSSIFPNLASFCIFCFSQTFFNVLGSFFVVDLVASFS